MKQAIQTIRKELIIKDEPLKAWKLLEAFKDTPGLKEERKNSYGMVRHYFDPEELKKAYQPPAEDCEIIENEEVIDDVGARYFRYGWVQKGFKEAKSYVDLGCYVGSMVIRASLDGLEATGVDYTPRVIEVAKGRAKARGVNPQFFVGDVTKWKPEKKVDLVSSMEVLEHVIDPDAYLAHMADMLNPGGWVYVSTPDGPYGDGEGNIKGGWEWNGKGVRGHLRVFTIETIKRMLKDYEISEIFGMHGLLNFSYRRPNDKSKS